MITIRRSLDVAALLGSFALAMSLTGQALALPALPRPEPAESTAISPRAVETASVQPASYNPTATPIALSLVASGFTKPVLVVGAGDRSGRLFIVEQTGRIRIWKAGQVLAKPFLDISASVSKGGEQGLLGLAFHPSFATNGKFYVDFTNASGSTAISEYRVSSTDRDVADQSTGRRIITITQPYANHNGGNIAFGPDRMLYIGMGDGGGAGDPDNRAQSIGSLLGKILRIDVNGTSGTKRYRVPSDNPYVGRTGADEIWARGLRNPWRWSFDRATGDLWIGDVGQSRYEEIDRARRTSTTLAGRNANYGWRVMEGRHCYNPATGCSTTGKTYPLGEYSHTYGCAVTGGYVYRGTAYPALAGGYFYGDYCSGRIWSMPANTTANPAAGVQMLDTDMMITSFGQDDAGELYVVDGPGGRIFEIVAAS
ncbi:MAG: PQQ-dependent sugar dehydrogenase [Chloroflexota bacterium]